MIKAGSLFYAIIISLIIAITSSSLILSAYLSKIQTENFEITRLLNLNADSGINLLLSKQTIIAPNQQKIIDLFNNGTDKVDLSLKRWGAYEIAISKASFKNQEITRIAQIGFYPDSADNYSLYLADEDKPLAVCGNTIIRGDAYLPRAGIKRAYIEGQSFSRSSLIGGDTKQSEKTLPKFNEGLIDYIQSITTLKKNSDSDSIIYIENGLGEDIINNSFQLKTIVFAGNEAFTISTGTYIGNILLISSKQITIGSGTSLKDIMVIAPKVIIKSGFRGNIQAFASDSILIEKKVTLIYPSVLGIVNENSTASKSIISLEEEDTLVGNIFIHTSELNALQRSEMSISEKAVIIGQVYSNGSVDLKGIIRGNLMCRKIILNTPSSVYENHLLNAVIDLNGLPKSYVGINLVAESESKKTIKWLQ